jgi:hypothetical protein
VLGGFNHIPQNRQISFAQSQQAPNLPFRHDQDMDGIARLRVPEGYHPFGFIEFVNGNKSAQVGEAPAGNKGSNPAFSYREEKLRNRGEHQSPEFQLFLNAAGVPK